MQSAREPFKFRKNNDKFDKAIEFKPHKIIIRGYPISVVPLLNLFRHPGHG